LQQVPGGFGEVMSDIDQRPRVLYTAEATVTGGRRGHGATSDGVLEVDFTSPKEMGGDGARGTNPEQLFALGFGACWENAMLGIARRKGIDIADAVVTARVGIGLITAGRLGLTVELLIKLPSLQDREQAQALIEETEQRCPYSNAVRGNVEVTLTLL
jgi:osmotically inducible protein OsmC